MNQQFAISQQRISTESVAHLGTDVKTLTFFGEGGGGEYRLEVVCLFVFWLLLLFCLFVCFLT